MKSTKQSRKKYSIRHQKSPFAAAANDDLAALGRLFLGKGVRTFCFDIDIPGDLRLLLGATAWSIESGDQTPREEKEPLVTCRLTLTEGGLTFTDLLWLMKTVCKSTLPLRTLAYEGRYSGDDKPRLLRMNLNRLLREPRT